MATFTNQSKNSISPTGSAKAYALQGVYGVGVYGIAIYGYGSAGFGAITNQSKNNISPTGITKN